MAHRYPGTMSSAKVMKPVGIERAMRIRRGGRATMRNIIPLIHQSHSPMQF